MRLADAGRPEQDDVVFDSWAHLNQLAEPGRGTIRRSASTTNNSIALDGAPVRAISESMPCSRDP